MTPVVVPNWTDANNWYSEASYGALGQTGAVTPWVRSAGPTATHPIRLRLRAKAAGRPQRRNAAGAEPGPSRLGGQGGYDIIGIQWRLAGSTAR